MSLNLIFISCVSVQNPCGWQRGYCNPDQICLPDGHNNRRCVCPENQVCTEEWASSGSAADQVGTTYTKRYSSDRQAALQLSRRVRVFFAVKMRSQYDSLRVKGVEGKTLPSLDTMVAFSYLFLCTPVGRALPDRSLCLAAVGISIIGESLCLGGSAGNILALFHNLASITPW